MEDVTVNAQLDRREGTDVTPLLRPYADTLISQPSRWARLKERYVNRRVYNILMMSLGMMITYIAYNTAQNYMTTFHTEAGFWSLTLVYIFGSVSSAIAPVVVEKLTARVCMFVCALPIPVFVLASCFNSNLFIYISSVFIGLGAGMLWPAQGVFTSENAGEEIGFYSGLFFTIYQLNMLIGSLIAASLLEIGLGQFWTFFTLVLIGVIGIILMLYLVPHAPTHENQTPKEHKSLKHILYETGRLLVQKKMLMIFPLFMYSGWTQSFFYGVVPPLIGVRWLGWAMAAFGFAEVLGSMAFAKISDGLGRKISMILSLILHALAVTSSFFLKEQQPYMFFVTTTLCGLADAGLNTSIYAVIGCEEFYKNEAAYAFSAFQLIQGIVTSTGFFTGIYLTYLEIQIVLVVLLGAAIVSYIVLEVWIVKPKPTPEIN